MEGDFELLLAWQGGNNEAGDALVRRHFWGVYRFFRNKVDDAAEDLAQRTFLACVEARDRVRAELSFRAYLFGIARNQLTLYFRRHHRSAKLFSPAETSVADLSGGLPDGRLVHHQEQRALLSALRQIPVDFQIAIELYYWEEMSVAEVAAVLDVAPGTVKSRLGRARQRLRERLEAMELPAGTLQSTLGDLEGWARSLRDQGRSEVEASTSDAGGARPP